MLHSVFYGLFRLIVTLDRFFESLLNGNTLHIAMCALAVIAILLALTSAWLHRRK